MGWRPQVNSCQSEGFSYEKCSHVKFIIAAQESRWSKSVRVASCSRSSHVEPRFGLVSE